MEILNLDDFLSKGVVVGHVGFIPYKIQDDGNEQILLGMKDDKIAILGGGCKTSFEESPLACLSREIGEEVQFDINIDNITTVTYTSKDSSALMWYRVDTFAPFFSLKFGEEIRSVKVFDWSQICDYNSDLHINMFDGAPQWLTTTLARVVAFRNMCFFHNICSLEALLVSQTGIKLPYFTTVYPIPLFERVTESEFRNSNMEEMFIIPFNNKQNAKQSVWLTTQKKGNKMSFIKRKCQDQCNLVLDNVLDGMYPHMVEGGRCIYMTYLERTKPVGFVWIPMVNTFNRYGLTEVDWSHVVNKKVKIDPRTGKMVRRLVEFCNRWSQSLMTIHDDGNSKNKWRTKEQRLKQEEDQKLGKDGYNHAGVQCSLNDIIRYQNIVYEFQNEHMFVIEQILDYRDPAIPEFYIDNVFGFNPKPYLDRKYPLIQMYDQINFGVHDNANINYVVDDIIEWVSISSYTETNFIDVDLYTQIQNKIRDYVQDWDILVTKETQAYLDYIIV